jgi:hypothetical protein
MMALRAKATPAAKAITTTRLTPIRLLIKVGVGGVGGVTLTAETVSADEAFDGLPVDLGESEYQVANGDAIVVDKIWAALVSTALLRQSP